MVDTVQDVRPPDYDEPLDPESEAQIDAAFEAAKDAPAGPLAIHAEYLPSVQALSLCINTGQRLLIPIEELQYLSSATDEDRRQIEIIGCGDGIDFTALDVQFSVEGLLAGRRGNRSWMEALEATRAAALKAAA